MVSMHRMQSGGWPYSKVSRDSSKAPSLRAAALRAAVLRAAVLRAAVFHSNILRSNRNHVHVCCLATKNKYVNGV